MKQWFEKACHLWVEDGDQANEMLLHLAEDFFDALMAIHDSGKEGTSQVTEFFLPLIGRLASNSQVHISVQKEAVQKLNMILDAMPPELKKERKISSKEASVVVKELAGRIVEGGDYDLQAAMLEAIYRMTVASQRREFVHSWFTMDFVASAFLKIREPQFETDCRKFLNMVNGMKGDIGRVYSYPCLGVFLDKYELLMPSDEKLEEFWIDFNIGSQSISFYCTLASDETQEPSSTWETFFLPNNEVESYSVDEQENKKVLSVLLTSPRCLGEVSGSRISVHFSSSLDVLQAAQKVFGSAKSKRFVGKKGTSVVKTTVQIILDETHSQVLIPDSQISLSQRSEREQPAMNTAATCKPLPPSVPPQNSNPKPLLPQSVNPGRPKISESSTFISSSSGRRKLGGSPCTAVLPSSTPRGKVKPALQMISSVERKQELSLREMVATKTSRGMKRSPELPGSSKEQQSVPVTVPPPRSANPRPDPKRGNEVQKFRRHIPVDKVLEMVQTDESCVEEEPLDESMVPDSQPTHRKESSVLPGLWSGDFSKQKRSVCDSVVSGQRTNSCLAAPKPDPAPKPSPARPEPRPQQWRPPSALRGSKEVSQKELHNQLTQRLEALVKKKEQGTPAKGPLTGAAAGSSRSQTPCRAGAGAPGSGKARVGPGMLPEQKPLNPTPAKALLEKTTNPKAEAAPSDVTKKPTRLSAAKEKKSDEMTENMLKFISSHYQGTGCVSAKDSGQLSANAINKRSLFDKSWSLNSGVKGDRNSSGFLKSFDMSKKADFTEDIYAFQMNSPTSTGKNIRKTSEKSVMESSAISSSFTFSASAKKAPPEKVFSRHVQKHLFSDTDTDRDKENATDFSWLRDSARKPKPKVADYSRQPAKACQPPPSCVSDKSPDAPALSPKPAKEQAKPKRKKPQKKPVEQKAAAKPLAVARETAAVAKATVGATKATAGGARTSGRRPRRAAALDVSYKDPSDQSESDEPAALPAKKRRTSDPPKVPERPQPEVKKIKKVSPPPLEKMKIKKVSPPPKEKMKIKKVSPPPKEKMKMKKVSPPLEKTKAVKAPQESWACRVALSRYSPPPIERMRSAGMSPPLGLSPSTPLLPLCLSPVARPSPPPSLEMPKPMMGIQASSFYKPASGGKDKDKQTTPSLPTPALPTPIARTPSIASCRRSCGSEHPPLSPVRSLHSPAQPLLTSTALEKSPVGSLLKSTDLDQQLRDFVKAHGGMLDASDKESVITMATLSQSSHLSVNNVAILCTEIERTPASNKGSTNSGQMLQSGPSFPSRQASQSNSSHLDSDREDDDDEDQGEEEEEEARSAPRQKALKMKPRKLFKDKACLKQPEQMQSSSEEDEEEEEEQENVRGKKRRRAVKMTKKSYYTAQGHNTSTVDNMEVEMSSHMTSSTSGTWTSGPQGNMAAADAVHAEMSSSQEMGYVCREFSTELTRKFQKRSEKMELYTKQSLKTVQQHMSSVGLQMRKHRSQRLEKVKQALMEEISNLEQDDNALKSMEKELTIYWKKQTLAFHSYQEKESRRLQHLKNSFQTNVCHSLEYEQQIISSEMCLMKKDMKSVQDTFLQEMREEELSSMRRGLQSLFLSGAPLF
ncbi:synaptonemal complex protein 2 [Sardina pilchardus]|uniref:synaptonemal complex protein 2 n=1 Tax=Sardina pilchardus TaxID=27697 RepID=UPI002E166609